MKTNRSDNRIDTTPLGELMATVSEFAFEYSSNGKEAYDLARLILVKVLNRASPQSATIHRHFPGTVLLH